MCGDKQSQLGDARMNGITKRGSKEHLQCSVIDLLKRFGAGHASPGSGSAAALLGLLSAKMILTVCKISLKKDKCISNFDHLKLISEDVKEIEPRLRELFKKDAKDFDDVIKLKVRRDEESCEGKKSILNKEADDLLETTTEYVFEIAEISLKLMKYGITIFKIGWSPIRGDSGVSISSAMSGAMSSMFILNLNLMNLKKRQYAVNNLERCKDLQSRVQELQMEAFSCSASLSAESSA